jgi:hypothetical protein
MEELFEQLRVQIKVAQDHYETSAKKSHTHTRNLQVGYSVFLSAKHIHTTLNVRKLDWKWTGPYPVKRVISHYAYELDLLSSIEIHTVFHVSRLQLAPGDTLPGQGPLPPPPIEVKGMTEYAIEDIVDSRLYQQKVEYLV